MKGNIKRTIVLLLALCIGVISPIGFNTSTVEAQGNEGLVYNYDSANGTIEFGNQFLTRSFSVVEGKVKTTAVTNKVANENGASVVLVPQDGSQDFVITTKPNNVQPNVTYPTEQSKVVLPENKQVGQDAYQLTGEGSNGPASLMFDGDNNTYYHSKYTEPAPDRWDTDYPHNIYLDLGSEQTLKSFSRRLRTLADGSPTRGGRIKGYKIFQGTSYNQVSTVGEDQLTLVAEGEFTNELVAYGNFTQPVTGQFFRIVFTSQHQVTGESTNVATCSEFNFYTEPVVQNDVNRTTINASDLVMEGEPVFDRAAGTLRINFAPISARGVLYTISEVFTMKETDKFMRKHLEITVPEGDANNAVIDYIDLENMNLLPADTNGTGSNQSKDTNWWTIPELENNPDMAGMKGDYLELGQPYYVAAMYWGCEFPQAENKIRPANGDANAQKNAFIRYHYGKNLSMTSKTSDGQFNNYIDYNKANGQNGKMVTWDAVVGAARSRDYQVCQSDFYSYIETIATPTNFRQQFNSWYDNMKDINNTNILESFAQVEKGFTQYGVEPLDSYVVDDGWMNYNSFWDFDRSANKFPNELYDSSLQVNQMGSNFGLWLGPRGGYGTQETIANWISSQNPKLGSKNTAHKTDGYAVNDINISDARYLNKLVNDVFLDYQKKFNVNYWKLDGMLLVPSQVEGNHHVVGGEYYTISETYERWTDMYEAMRSNRSDLWINMTSYANPSPWHLQWVNSLWMQNTGDTGFDGYNAGNKTHKWGANDQQSMLTYRDGDYYDFFNINQWQLPNKYFYNHDPVYAKTAHRVDQNRHDPIEYTTDGLREHLYMLGTRGTAFWEYYYSPSMFDDAKWQVNAEAADWIESNFHILQKSKMFGGDPEQGKVYGYSCWNGNEGIVSIRNPKNEPQTIDVTFDRLIGVTDGVENLFGKVIIGKLDHQNNNPLKYGDTRQYTLQPMEVLIIQYGAQDTTIPTIDSLKGSGKVLEVEFNETMRPAVKENYTVTKVDGANETALTVEKAELDADRRTVKLTLNQVLEDAANYKVVVNGAQDTVGNRCANVEKTDDYYKDGVTVGVFNRDFDGNTEVNKGAEKSIDGHEGFSITAKFNTTTPNVVLAEQENVFTLGINNEGYATFTFNGMTITSQYVEKNITRAVTEETKGIVTDGNTHIVNAVKEVNGMIKLYLDGKVVSSAYDDSNNKVVNPELTKSNVKFGRGFNGHADVITLSDKALAFDEIARQSQTPVANIAASSNGTTVSAWDATTNSLPTLNGQMPLSNANDGNKNHSSNYGELGDVAGGNRHSRYYQFTLPASYNVETIKLTRYHDNRIYGPTVIALYEETDTEFANPTIVFNTDKDNFHKFNVQHTDEYYPETSAGKEITNIKPNNTKIIRVYVSGQVDNQGNPKHNFTSDHLVEFEATGKLSVNPLPGRIDYTELEKVVNKDLSVYTTTSKTTYETNAAELLTQAQALLTDKNATSDKQVDDLVAAIVEKQAVLALKADTTAANELYNTIKDLQETTYKPSTWTEFATARQELADAVAEGGNADLSQEQLDAIITRVNDAKGKLVERTDLTAANALMAELNGLKQDSYTTSSWETFVNSGKKEALDEAIKNLEITPEALANAVKEAQDAKDALVVRANMDAANTLNNEIKEYKEETYTPNTWTEFNEARAALQTAIANAANMSEAELKPIYDRALAAKEALQTRANTTDATALLTELNGLKEADYTANSWQGLPEKITALDEAIKDLNISQTDLDAIVDAARTAKEALVERANTEEAQTLIGEVNRLNAIDYTRSTFDKLMEAKKGLEDLLVDTSNLVQSELDPVYQQVLDAKNALKERANLDEVKKLIGEYRALNSEDYTKDSWEVLEKAYYDLLEIVSGDVAELTPEDVNPAYKVTLEAKANLVKRANLEKAKKVLEEVNALKQNNYTQSSWDKLAKAKAALEEAIKDNSNLVQAQVDKLIKDVVEAKFALQVKPEVTPKPTQKPESTVKPTVKPEPTKKPVANGDSGYDDGGPFVTDKCGSIYDRWGNLMWKAPACNAQTNDGYTIVNTSDR